jgi:hypothetical protein
MQYPKPGQQLRSRFAIEAACFTYLEQLRWRKGFCCPKCESSKGWRLAAGCWSCSRCTRRVSVKTGTIFHCSRISLKDWFIGAWEMTERENGISALELQKELGLGCYQSAWTMLHKLRSAMGSSVRDRLRGSVEIDRTYVGGVQQGVCGPQPSRQFVVAIAIEIAPLWRPRLVRLCHMRDDSSDSLVRFVCEVVEPGADVYTNKIDNKNLRAHGYDPGSRFAKGNSPHAVMPSGRKVDLELEAWLDCDYQGAGVIPQHIWTPTFAHVHPCTCACRSAVPPRGTRHTH